MEQRTGTMSQQPHQLILQDRKALELTGVTDVDSFDDTVITAYTSLGQLTIRGKQLHMQQLDVEGGSLSLSGEIDSLTYANVPHASGFFGRLFR